MKSMIAGMSCGLLLIAGCSESDSAETISGMVTEIHDVNLIAVQVGKENIKVRITGVSAAEAGEPISSDDKTSLGAQLQGKEVRIEVDGSDDDGNTVGNVFRIDDEEIHVTQSVINDWLENSFLNQ